MLLRFFQKYYLLIFCVLLLPVAKDRVAVNPRSLIWSDMEGYYLYLPAAFIYKDFHHLEHGTMADIRNDKGEFAIKYTYGVALFYLPLFLLTRALSPALGADPNDIFGPHYCYAFGLTGYLIGFLGLFFLKRALQREFSEKTVFWTLMATFLGTNLFHYTTREMTMSHVYSFFLFAFTAWQTPRFLEKPSGSNAALLGGALGWTILIRPTNILLALFVLLYNVYSGADLRERLGLLLRQYRALLIAAAAAFLFFIPQMWYWYEMWGQWLKFSYVGEDFRFWKEPKIAAVLFDVQNGLFLYSPMVLLSFIGIGFTWQARKLHAPANALLMVLATYIFASWWAWWFGGAFGHRCYVEFYALLAFPLGYMIDKMLTVRRVWLRILWMALLVFLMYYSVRLSFLYKILPGPWDGADWRWNWDKIEWVWSYLFRHA